jgi:hypothetical protein
MIHSPSVTVLDFSRSPTPLVARTLRHTAARSDTRSATTTLSRAHFIGSFGSVSLFAIHGLDFKNDRLSSTHPDPTLAHAHSCCTGAFEPQTRVALHGLSDARFNDCVGVVMGYIPDSGRHIVKLASGKTIKVITRTQSIHAPHTCTCSTYPLSKICACNGPIFTI